MDLINYSPTKTNSCTATLGGIILSSPTTNTPGSYRSHIYRGSSITGLECFSVVCSMRWFYLLNSSLEYALYTPYCFGGWCGMLVSKGRGGFAVSVDGPLRLVARRHMREEGTCRSSEQL